METFAWVLLGAAAAVRLPAAGGFALLGVHALADAWRGRRDRRRCGEVVRLRGELRARDATIARQRAVIASQHDQLRDLAVQARLIECHLSNVVGRN